jgi:hypothetical protein
MYIVYDLNNKYMGAGDIQAPAERNSQPIVMKFCTVDKVDKITELAKMVAIGWLGTASHLGEI